MPEDKPRTLICRYCGEERSDTNKYQECIKRSPTWFDMWPRHEWVERALINKEN